LLSFSAFPRRFKIFKNMKLSKIAFFVCAFVLAYANLFFYPKWKKEGAEATLSYDVCGYYYYLPTFFIYKDPKKVAFHTQIDEKYLPQGGGFYSALPHPPTGNLVMKYSAGMALMYAPTFFAAHHLANAFGYPADGFSKPYQLAISVWSLLWAFLGLWYLRKLLLKLAFTEGVTASVLLLITLTTNYLEYAGITNAMPHSYIFTLYTLMLWATIHFYSTPSVKQALQIGICLGLAILARPTEAIIAIVPVLWGIGNWQDLVARIGFIQKHFSKYLMAAAVVLALGFIQLAYYKFLTGQWVYKSYGKDDWMEWKTPHIADGLFSSRRGWLVYTPVMVFALAGFWHLWQQRRTWFWAIVPFSCLFIYVSFAHNIWWYGGSLGQRQMIQIYPLLALPLALFLTAIAKTRLRQVLFSIATVICFYLNIWLVGQAHLPDGLWRDETTQAYLRATIGRWKVPIETEKLLDNKYDFKGKKQQTTQLFESGFETDTSQFADNQTIINGKRSLFVDRTHDRVTLCELKTATIPNFKKQKWMRAEATFKLSLREWTSWKMPMFLMSYYKGTDLVKSFGVRPTRVIFPDNATKRVSLDAKIAKLDFDRVVIEFWNPGSDKKMWVDDLVVESFDE
jgi:hypothetical protein